MASIQTERSIYQCGIDGINPTSEGHPARLQPNVPNPENGVTETKRIPQIQKSSEARLNSNVARLTTRALKNRDFRFSVWQSGDSAAWLLLTKTI